MTVGGTAGFTTSAGGADIVLDELAVTGDIALATHGPMGHATLVNSLRLSLGVTQVVGSLNVTSPAGISIVHGIITTSGAQTFVGPVTLEVNTILTGAGVTFSGTVDGEAVLEILDAGTTTLNGVIGSTTALEVLDVSAVDGITATGIHTTGNVSLTSVGAAIASLGEIMAGSVSIATNSLDLDAGITTAVTNGPINLRVDSASLDGVPDDAIDAGSGRITIRTQANSRGIDLGSQQMGRLSLVNDEVEKFRTTGVLQIGSVENQGGIVVSQDVALTNVNRAHLITGSTVTGTTGGIGGDVDLAITATGPVTLSDADTAVSRLAVITSAGVTFTEANGFVVGRVDGVAGITASGGSVRLTTAGDLTINNTSDITNVAACDRVSRDIQTPRDLLIDVSGELTFGVGAVIEVTEMGAAVFSAGAMSQAGDMCLICPAVDDSNNDSSSNGGGGGGAVDDNDIHFHQVPETLRGRDDAPNVKLFLGKTEVDSMGIRSDIIVAVRNLPGIPPDAPMLPFDVLVNWKAAKLQDPAGPAAPPVYRQPVKADYLDFYDRLGTTNDYIELYQNTVKCRRCFAAGRDVGAVR